MYEYDVCYVDGDSEQFCKTVQADEWSIVAANHEIQMVQFVVNGQSTVKPRIVFVFPAARLVCITELGELAELGETAPSDPLPTL